MAPAEPPIAMMRWPSMLRLPASQGLGIPFEEILARQFNARSPSLVPKSPSPRIARRVTGYAKSRRELQTNRASNGDHVAPAQAPYAVPQANFARAVSDHPEPSLRGAKRRSNPGRRAAAALDCFGFSSQ
jgi:hypothetical protein